VVNFTRIDAVAGMGAAYTGVRSPWANLAIAGATHARMQHLVLSVGNPDARRVWFPPATATTMQRTLRAALLPSVSETVKQTVQKTRINAGGYGVLGPHPEREPA
jgi:hypothetical protein